MKDRQTVFQELLQDAPVIAAVKNEEGLANALRSECAVIFILYGTILDIAEVVERIKAAGKLAFIHADMVEGLSNREISVDYLKKYTRADGLISTRPNMIRRAKDLGLITIQRFFLLDSLAFENVERQSCNADLIDILPGAMPSVIQRLSTRMKQPMIASGLLVDKRDVCAALSAGAIAVSTTCEALWDA